MSQCLRCNNLGSTTSLLCDRCRLHAQNYAYTDITKMPTGPMAAIPSKLQIVPPPPSAATLFEKTKHRTQTKYKRLRIAFICLTILSVVALIIDTVLLSVAFLRAQHPAPAALSGPPTLTTSSEGRDDNVAIYGQHVTLHLRHFTPLTHVYLTHDVQEPIETANNTSLIQVDQNGAADPSTVITTRWEPGFHNLEAEDITSRYSASATLQIIHTGAMPPARLSISHLQLDLGADTQGANTVQSLTLHNSGTGIIPWTANSNQPWLLLTPSQGVFSDSQTIIVAVQRANLKPGIYDKGKIRFSSNSGTIDVQITMTVRPLPPNPGPVLTVTPAVLSLTAVDGGADPTSTQTLVITNPGSRPLHWVLASNTPNVVANQTSFPPSANWLSTNQSAGLVLPSATQVVQIIAHSQGLLPGTYINTLIFTADQGTINNPQNVSISLTVQPRCGLRLSTGSMTFTAISAESNPGNQVLGVAATANCSTINWYATTSASWLTISPASGQLKTATNAVTSVGVNAASLQPGTYTANITVVGGQNTQSVIVMLTVQPPPSANAPIMGVSTLNLDFSTTQGQTNPPGQGVTITNTGGSTLQWHTTTNQSASSWLRASSTGGQINAGATGQLIVNVNSNNLTPGNYVGQIILSGTDGSNAPASGSPQTITVNLLVSAPCALQQPSSSAFAFTATQGGLDPNAQAVGITASGNCAWPVNWQARLNSAVPWLQLSPSSASGSFSASGQSAMLTISPSIAGIAPGTYQAKVSVTAFDSAHMQTLGSPQVFTVSLTVLQSCVLKVSPSNLSFTVLQGQNSTTRNLTLAESSNCAFPVSWTATGDAQSSGWLVVTASSGNDTGHGSTIGVSVNAAHLLPGTHTGSITIAASGSNGAVIESSPQTIPITVTVTGFTISGVVNICADPTCIAPIALPNAVLNLVNSSGTQVQSVITDVTGHYTFTGVPVGSYTITVNGFDSAGLHFSGNTPVSVTGNQSGLIINLSPI